MNARGCREPRARYSEEFRESCELPEDGRAHRFRTISLPGYQITHNQRASLGRWLDGCVRRSGRSESPSRRPPTTSVSCSRTRSTGECIEYPVSPWRTPSPVPGRHLFCSSSPCLGSQFRMGTRRFAARGDAAVGQGSRYRLAGGAGRRASSEQLLPQDRPHTKS